MEANLETVVAAEGRHGDPDLGAQALRA